MMQSQRLLVSKLKDSFPDGFEFYDLGFVKRSSEEVTVPTSPFESLKEKTALSYRLHSDLDALVILLFDRDLDSSMYAEIGNVITSRMVNRLFPGEDALTSSPTLLPIDRFKRLLEISRPHAIQRYFHVYEQFLIPIQTFLFISERKDLPYA